jgi:hypothetical protein
MNLQNFNGRDFLWGFINKTGSYWVRKRILRSKYAAETKGSSFAGKTVVVSGSGTLLNILLKTIIRR